MSFLSRALSTLRPAASSVSVALPVSKCVLTSLQNRVNNLTKQSFKNGLLSFDQYVTTSIGSFEKYKNGMKTAFPEDSDEQLKKSYNAYCKSIYKCYVETSKSDNDPGRAI